MAISKSFILITLLCALHSVSSAQRFDAGILGGITGSQISGDNLAGFHKAGLQGGLFSTYTINSNWDLQTELYYIQKGSRQRVDPESQVAINYYRLRLHYLEFPVLARYHHGRFLFEAGLSAGALIKSVEEDFSGILPQTILFNRSEFAWHAGLGTRFGDRVSMIWRFSGSILPVRKHPGGATLYLDRGQHNSVLHFILQYRFRGRE